MMRKFIDKHFMELWIIAVAIIFFGTLILVNR